MAPHPTSADAAPDAVSDGVPADDSSLSSQDLAFRARALAQAHALTEAGLRYRAWRIEHDRPQHPIPELSTWAATAFLTGYCIRCVEESWPPVSPQRPGPEEHADDNFEMWHRRASDFANALPTDTRSTLLDHRVVVAAIDDVIAREIDKRTEHVKEQVPESEWSRFQDFVGWWVVHGYSIRAVER